MLILVGRFRVGFSLVWVHPLLFSNQLLKMDLPKCNLSFAWLASVRYSFVLGLQFRIGKPLSKALAVCDAKA